ncbi:MAG: antitoxin [Crocosphaera sp.]|nr:antitoxin [Crocosphaera sp.]
MNQFSQEEKDILQSFEQGEWISKGTPERLKQLQLHAKNRHNFEQKITLNLSNEEVTSLEAQAREKGISCEQLLSSILRKYLTGKLIEK